MCSIKRLDFQYVIGYIEHYTCGCAYSKKNLTQQ